MPNFEVEMGYFFHKPPSRSTRSFCSGMLTTMLTVGTYGTTSSAAARLAKSSRATKAPFTLCGNSCTKRGFNVNFRAMQPWILSLFLRNQHATEAIDDVPLAPLDDIAVGGTQLAG